MAIVLLGLSAFGINQAYAQSNASPISSLAQAIAQKFNLDPIQVQSEITTYRTQNKQNWQQNRLNNLVTQGKITQTQELAITNELDTLKTKYNLGSLKTMTPDQRKQAMQNFRNDFETWAKSQNISLPLFGLGFRKFHRLGW